MSSGDQIRYRARYRAKVRVRVRIIAGCSVRVMARVRVRQPACRAVRSTQVTAHSMSSVKPEINPADESLFKSQSGLFLAL